MKHRPTLLLLLLTMALTMQAATENIRIMSYNIPMGNIKPEEGNGDNTWAKRALAIHRYMATVQPDLVGMQEPVRASLCDMLRGMPGYAMVGTGRNDGREGGEYTSILYRTDRFYCIANDTYWLTETPKVHSKVDGSTHFRIATWALFEDKETGARFLYTNTHLSYDSPKVKDAQLRVMKPTMKTLQDQYGSSLPHFLTGDFNMKDYENVSGEDAAARQGGNYLLCLNLGVVMKDAWVQARTKKHYSYGNAYPPGRIDYIFVSKNVSCKYAQWDSRTDADGYIMSDHDPIWADVYFTTSAEDNARAAIREAWNEVDSTYLYDSGRTRLITTSSQLSSDGVLSSYGLANIIDNNTNTYCQSASSNVPNQPHYVQVELRRDITDCRFMYYRRNDATDGVADRWQDIMVTASDNGTDWNYITHFNDFGDTPMRSYTSGNISFHRPYRYVRFSVMHTPGETLRNGNPQFALSELQLYENLRNAQSPRFVDEAVQAAAEEVEAQIAVVQENLDAGTIKRTHVTDLQAATEALRTARRDYASSVNPTSLPVGGRQGEIYDLSGRQLNTIPARGIYIRNGRAYAK